MTVDTPQVRGARGRLPRLLHLGVAVIFGVCISEVICAGRTSHRDAVLTATTVTAPHVREESDARKPTHYRVYAAHKSGSSAIHMVLRSLCVIKQIDHFSENNVQPFHEFRSRMKSVTMQRISADVVDLGLPNTSLVVGPLRYFTSLEGHPESGSVRVVNIVQLRDPLDTLVSMYFSFGFSHATPVSPEDGGLFEKDRESARSMSIDDWVLANVPRVQSIMEPLLRVEAARVPIRWLDFRQMVVAHETWARTLASALEMRDPAAAAEAVAWRHETDIREILSGRSPMPGAPSHVHSPLAGAHLVFLRPETVSKLKELLVAEVAFVERVLGTEDPGSCFPLPTTERKAQP